MTPQPNVVIVNNVRYRREDAYRLGLITDGKAITSRSENVTNKATTDGGEQVTTEQDPAEGDSAPSSTSPNQEATGPVRPTRNASREEWAQYALAQGVLEEDIADLKRDEISEMFPDDPAEDEDQ